MASSILFVQFAVVYHLANKPLKNLFVSDKTERNFAQESASKFPDIFLQNIFHCLLKFGKHPDSFNFYDLLIMFVINKKYKYSAIMVSVHSHIIRNQYYNLQ